MRICTNQRPQLKTGGILYFVNVTFISVQTPKYLPFVILCSGLKSPSDFMVSAGFF
jgi:hypothetical protein